MDQLKFEGNCINIKMHKFLNKYISNNINTLAFPLSLPIRFKYPLLLFHGIFITSLHDLKRI